MMKNNERKNKKTEAAVTATRWQRWREKGKRWWKKALELNAIFWQFRWPLVIFHTVKDFIQSKYFSRDVPSLAFSTAMSLIPLLAMFFAVARGFGQEEDIEGWMRQTFAAQPQVADTLMEYVHNYLQNYQGQYVFIVGLGLMVYSLHFLMQDIERVFDLIWRVKERPLTKRIFVYTSYYVFCGVMLFATSFFTVASVVVRDTMQGWLPWWNISELMSWLMAMIPMSVFFVVTYKTLPHTYVRWENTIVPGCLAGIFSVLLIKGFLSVQVSLTSYNIIYGSLAIIPLLMVLLKWSWGICIFFATMVHSNQHSELLRCKKGLKEFSHRMQMHLALKVVQAIGEETKEEPYSKTPMEMAAALQLPLRLVCEVLEMLKAKRVINEVENLKEGNHEDTAHYCLVREALLEYDTLVAALEQAGYGEEDLQDLCNMAKIE